MTAPLLDVRGLSTDYTLRRGGKAVRIHAVKDVSFKVLPVNQSNVGKIGARGKALYENFRDWYFRDMP